MESPLQERVWLVCQADMARTFEYVLHCVKCVTVTVSPNQIIIIIIHYFHKKSPKFDNGLSFQQDDNTQHMNKKILQNVMIFN